MKESKKCLWLACDRDNTLVLFPYKPFRDKWFGFWCKFKDGFYCCNDGMTVREYERNRFVVPRNFCNLSWEDEPVRVTLSLEPEVIASDDAATNLRI